MTKKWMAVLALGLLAPAAFGQTAMNRAPAPVNVLRQEIKSDKGGMTGATKAFRSERQELLAQEKAELVKVGKTSGTRSQKKQARQAVRAKYASLLKEAHAKSADERKSLLEDITSKRAQIKKLRQS